MCRKPLPSAWAPQSHVYLLIFCFTTQGQLCLVRPFYRQSILATEAVRVIFWWQLCYLLFNLPTQYDEQFENSLTMLNHTEVHNPLMSVELEKGLPLPWNLLILATHQRQASDCLTGDLEIRVPTRSNTCWTPFLPLWAGPCVHRFKN